MKNNKLFLSMIIVMMMWLVGCPAEPEKKDEKKDDNIPSQPVTNALSSLRNLEHFDKVFTLEYNGNYYLDNVINAEPTSDRALLKVLTEQIPGWKTVANNTSIANIDVSGDFACASIVANNASSVGGKIYGRNFDWSNEAVLLLHTKPYNGYESYSTACLEFIGIKNDWTIAEPTSEENIIHNAQVLAAIYAPMDGMNEKGLYISNLMAGDDETTDQTEAGKKAIQTTVAIRLILDRAANVDEAKALLQQYNMYSVYNTAHHFAIADNAGNYTVVEWHNNQIYFTNSRVVTNHYVNESIPNTELDEANDSFTRFNTLKTAGESKNWNMTPVDVKDALQAASAHQYSDSGKHLTVWSAVFEPNARRITYYFREDYEHSVTVTF